ncbi:MAG: hypothetical protein WCN95_16160, partial [bacterium]
MNLFRKPLTYLRGSVAELSFSTRLIPGTALLAMLSGFCCTSGAEIVINPNTYTAATEARGCAAKVSFKGVPNPAFDNPMFAPPALTCSNVVTSSGKPEDPGRVELDCSLSGDSFLTVVSDIQISIDTPAPWGYWGTLPEHVYDASGNWVFDSQGMPTYQDIPFFFDRNAEEAVGVRYCGRNSIPSVQGFQEVIPSHSGGIHRDYLLNLDSVPNCAVVNFSALSGWNAPPF